MGTDTAVVLPTYQEAATIGPILDRIRAAVPDATLLVVDDASPDGTGDIVESMAQRSPEIRLLRRSGKLGLGTAYREAFELLRAEGFMRFVQIDADGSHAPEALQGLLSRSESADLVIGSRWVEGGSVVNWPYRRELLSRGANLYARTAIRSHIKDVTAGFRVYTRDALDAIDLSSVKSEGYSFQIEMTSRAQSAGLRIVEVPITFVDREAGRSKMSGRVVAEALMRTTIWALRSAK